MYREARSGTSRSSDSAPAIHVLCNASSSGHAIDKPYKVPAFLASARAPAKINYLPSTLSSSPDNGEPAGTEESRPNDAALFMLIASVGMTLAWNTTLSS